jgi:hypothetical protein
MRMRLLLLSLNGRTLENSCEYGQEHLRNLWGTDYLIGMFHSRYPMGYQQFLRVLTHHVLANLIADFEKEPHANQQFAPKNHQQSRT